jgi:hypothetical protein
MNKTGTGHLVVCLCVSNFSPPVQYLIFVIIFLHGTFFYLQAFQKICEEPWSSGGATDERTRECEGSRVIWLSWNQILGLLQMPISLLIISYSHFKVMWPVVQYLLSRLLSVRWQLTVFKHGRTIEEMLSSFRPLVLYIACSYWSIAGITNLWSHSNSLSL